jgi:hypothetical protein
VEVCGGFSVRASHRLGRLQEVGVRDCSVVGGVAEAAGLNRGLEGKGRLAIRGGSGVGRPEPLWGGEAEVRGRECSKTQQERQDRRAGGLSLLLAPSLYPPILSLSLLLAPSPSPALSPSL